MKSRSAALAVLSMLAIGLGACTATPAIPNTGGYGASSATTAPAATMSPATAQPAPNTGLYGSPATMPPAATQAMPGTGSPQPMPNTGSTGAAQVMVASNARFGSILVDTQGRTLYLLTKDGPNMPTCYTSCAQLWPPLLTTGQATAGSGLDASKLGTAMRTDGGTQVTYNGHPLYYFAQDAKPGDTNGQGFGGVWFVVSSSGDPIMK